MSDELWVDPGGMRRSAKSIRETAVRLEGIVLRLQNALGSGNANLGTDPNAENFRSGTYFPSWTSLEGGVRGARGSYEDFANSTKKVADIYSDAEEQAIEEGRELAHEMSLIVGDDGKGGGGSEPGQDGGGGRDRSGDGQA